MIYIQVPDMNDSLSTVTIDDKEWLLRFTYNEIGDYWSFGIYDLEEEPILAMTKIVPNFPLIHFYNYTDLPNGVFGALSTEGRIGRETFNDGKAEFVFIPIEELEEE